MNCFVLIAASALACLALAWSSGTAGADPSVKIDPFAAVADVFLGQATGFEPNTPLTVSIRPANGSSNWIIIDTSHVSSPSGSWFFTLSTSPFGTPTLSDILDTQAQYVPPPPPIFQERERQIASAQVEEYWRALLVDVAFCDTQNCAGVRVDRSQKPLIPRRIAERFFWNLAPTGGNVQRQVCGFEKTFFNGLSTVTTEAPLFTLPGYQGVINLGFDPLNSRLAQECGINQAELERLLKRLQGNSLP
jgi:hypothetical protein